MTLPVTDFIVQRLLEYDSSFDVGAGVPTTGLLIEPLSVILQPIVDEISLIQSSQSVLTILESSSPDLFPEDIVDGLASNVFIERNPGSIGSDVIRLRYFSPSAFSVQKAVLVFLGPDGERYTNSEAVSISVAEMSLNQDGSLYYVDIPIVALEEGSSFNVSAGSITTMESEPVGVANLTNLYGVSDGADRETNTELIDRIKVAVTVRALVTGRGIVVSLTENFTTIEEIEPIGFGDPEMMRDIVYNVHIGGNVDVYVKTASLTESSTDVFGLAPDTSRQRSGSTALVALVEGATYSLEHVPIDRTNRNPVVTSVDNLSVFREDVDYTLSDELGLFSRISGSSILHEEAVNGVISYVGPGGQAKILSSTGTFANARRGMVITVSSPSSVAGSYTIKNYIDPDTVEIYGSFPGSSFPLAGVNFQLDELVVISYEYNPVSIDIIEEARSSTRSAFTITDVPVMDVTSIEVLDPISGEPTGEELDATGGFGAGGFGAGGFGVGSRPDYTLVVAEPTLRHSQREDSYIEFRAANLGLAVRVNYQYADAIEALQAYVDDRNNQTEAASLLIRHFIPVFVDAPSAIAYTIPASTSATAISSDEMAQLVKDFIDGISEGEPLELSDIVDLMYNNGATFVDLSDLQAMRGSINHHDGTVEYAVPTEAGSMEIPDEDIPDPTDKPLSPRIARFIARDITMTRTVA